MSRLFVCDQCSYQQDSPLSFELMQITDEEDDDGDELVMVLDLCSSSCLSDYAMSLSLDFPDSNEEESA